MLQSHQRFFTPYKFPAAVTDFLIQCVAVLCATTVYSSAPQVLNGLLILPAVAAFLQPSPAARETNKLSPKSTSNGKPTSSLDEATADDKDPLPIKPFITTYRGAMMIITCASILAVDFNVFPRRFAKTETFGTSLMDMGVGSFVFAAGLSAARQQLREQEKKSYSFVARFKNSLRHSFPLLILGVVRLLSVKGLEYAEHVSEYGVHWNFFFTLAVIPLMVAIIQPVLRIIPSYNILAFVLAICYELVLFLIPNMKRWILLSERKQGDWLSQNREGVFSLVGYLAIFISGMGIGLNILPRDPGPELPPKDPLDQDSEWLASVLGQNPDDEQTIKPAEEIPQLKPEFPKTTLPRLAFFTFLWFVFSVWAMWRYGPRLIPSRRMANLAYVCWVCTFNCAQLLAFCMIETAMFPNLYTAKDKETERKRVHHATSKVMQAFNRNGLALFLLANLLTGLVNMTMPTIHMDDVSAMAILVAYMATICSVALALDHYNVSIKL